MGWDERFLQLAETIASWSKDPSTQVGAVIVRPDKTIASIGFNGFPKRMADDKELYLNRDEKYSRIIHAEINAQIFCTDRSMVGYTLYTWPFAPCDRCCVQMIQCAISRIVCPAPSEDALKRWSESLNKTRKYCQECGVELVEMKVDFTQD